jgi:hypothetical protein
MFLEKKFDRELESLWRARTAGVIAPWYARELGQEPPTDSRKLLDFICRVGSAGLKTLKDDWDNRTKNQIELAILRMVSRTTVVGKGRG